MHARRRADPAEAVRFRTTTGQAYRGQRGRVGRCSGSRSGAGADRIAVRADRAGRGLAAALHGGGRGRAAQPVPFAARLPGGAVAADDRVLRRRGHEIPPAPRRGCRGTKGRCRARRERRWRERGRRDWGRVAGADRLRHAGPDRAAGGGHGADAALCRVVRKQAALGRPAGGARLGLAGAAGGGGTVRRRLAATAPRRAHHAGARAATGTAQPAVAGCHGRRARVGPAGADRAARGPARRSLVQCHAARSAHAAADGRAGARLSRVRGRVRRQSGAGTRCPPPSRAGRWCAAGLG